MIIYRIQRRTNHLAGAYRGFYNNWTDYSDITPYQANHPIMNRDTKLMLALSGTSYTVRTPFGLIPDPCMYFGFESIQSLKDWFFDLGWLAAFKNHDYVIGMYECDPDAVFIGEAQVLFRMDSADLFDYKEITDICTDEQKAVIEYKISVAGQKHEEVRAQRKLKREARKNENNIQNPSA